MPDKVETQNQTKDKEFIDQLNKIKWPFPYGNVRVQIKASKPSLVFIEKTIKLD